MKMKKIKTSRKNAAFTLAETLITIGIIGVVAAMTIPTLIHKYRENIVATKLEKTYAEFQQVVKLSEAENDDISGWDFTLDPADFAEKYIAPYFSQSTSQNLGMRSFYLLSASTTNRRSLANYRNLDRIIGFRLSTDCYEIYVDFNGYDSPNRMGSDIFLFSIYKNGITRYCYEGLPLIGSSGSAVKTSESLKNHDCKSTGNGFNCGLVIQQNGWKIPKDYPLKL
jgi:type II secretory pathway pseudopilin PulG